MFSALLSPLTVVLCNPCHQGHPHRSWGLYENLHRTYTMPRTHRVDVFTGPAKAGNERRYSTLPFNSVNPGVSLPVLTLHAWRVVARVVVCDTRRKSPSRLNSSTRRKAPGSWYTTPCCTRKTLWERGSTKKAAFIERTLKHKPRACEFWVPNGRGSRHPGIMSTKRRPGESPTTPVSTSTAGRRMQVVISRSNPAAGVHSRKDENEPAAEPTVRLHRQRGTQASGRAILGAHLCTSAPFTRNLCHL